MAEHSDDAADAGNLQPTFDFAVLRRWPDVEADNLFAHDAADKLLLDTAQPLLAGLEGSRIAVVNDRYGALTLALAAAGLQGIHVVQDARSAERALDNNASRLGLTGYRHHVLEPDAFEGVRLVLLQLPRSLDELEEIAGCIAAAASPDVTVLAGGRVKHMSTAMNAVLATSFSSVTAGLARQKARILTASGPLPSAGGRFPRTEEHGVGLPAPLRLVAFGGTFGGPKVDPGTRFLLPLLNGARQAERAVDLGCGNGTIAAYLALSRDGMRVLAMDQSASAVRSARATAEANAVTDRVEVRRDDALSSLPAASEQLIVLNPPFHMGNTVHAGIALKLFADAGRVLAPGGELWTVWNSHLAYKPALNRLVGPTRQVARNPKFTVTVSTRD
ncbi:class I SAM-dependent methyltransferase [Arthrobacter sp. NPDC055138]